MLKEISKASVISGLGLLLVAALGVDAHAAAEPKRIEFQPDQLQFAYQSQDGTFQVPCTHRLAHEALSLFEVVCKQGPIQKTFSAIFWMKDHSAGTDQREQDFEINYRVLDHVDARTTRFSGHGSYMRLSAPSKVHYLRLMEEVENGYGQVNLTYRSRL